MAWTTKPKLSHEDAESDERACGAIHLLLYEGGRRTFWIRGRPHPSLFFPVYRDSEGRDMKFDPLHVARSLRKSWSRASARQWTETNPAAGQCNVTALLVYELFGGELLKTRLPEGDHFYNWIDGQRYDFTESQFSQPICYADIPTTPTEAERGATSSELAALKAAFVRHSTSSG